MELEGITEQKKGLSNSTPKAQGDVFSTCVMCAYRADYEGAVEGCRCVLKGRTVQDGGMPLPDGWVDAWMHLQRKGVARSHGWTMDTVVNKMLAYQLQVRAMRRQEKP